MRATDTISYTSRDCFCRFISKEFCPVHGKYKVKYFDRVSGKITYYPISIVTSYTRSD